MRILCALFLLLPLSVFAEWYLGIHGGQSSTKISGADRIEDRLFALQEVKGEYTKDLKSSTVELQIAYAFARRYDVRAVADLRIIEGIELAVNSRGTLSIQDWSREFTADRVIRVRGYMLSALAQWRISQKTSLFGGVGAMYVIATGDVYAMGSPYSLHAEKKAWVPAVRGGVSIAYDDRCSLVGEARAYGVVWSADRRVAHYLLGGSCALR